jgi:hypothetical protein
VVGATRWQSSLCLTHEPLGAIPDPNHSNPKTQELIFLLNLMFKPIFRHNMTAKIAQFFTDYIDF